MERRVSVCHGLWTQTGQAKAKRGRADWHTGSVYLVWDLEDPGGHNIYLLDGLSPEAEGLHSVSTPACLRRGGRVGVGQGNSRDLTGWRWCWWRAERVQWIQIAWPRLGLELTLLSCWVGGAKTSHLPGLFAEVCVERVSRPSLLVGLSSLHSGCLRPASCLEQLSLQDR